jgi:hypothetical protein
MAVYVVRDGVLVDRRRVEPARVARSHLPAPMLSRIEPFESPVTGKEITSWRERDRDMAAAGAVDPRDLPKNPRRGRAVQFKEAKEQHGSGTGPADPSTFRWTDPA